MLCYVHDRWSYPSRAGALSPLLLSVLLRAAVICLAGVRLTFPAEKLAHMRSVKLPHGRMSR